MKLISLCSLRPGSSLHYVSLRITNTYGLNLSLYYHLIRTKLRNMKYLHLRKYFLYIGGKVHDAPFLTYSMIHNDSREIQLMRMCTHTYMQVPVVRHDPDFCTKFLQFCRISVLACTGTYSRNHSILSDPVIPY